MNPFLILAAGRKGKGEGLSMALSYLAHLLRGWNVKGEKKATPNTLPL